MKFSGELQEMTVDPRTDHPKWRCKFSCSRNSQCDHSRKRPALVTTTFMKPRLKCDFVMKSSRHGVRNRDHFWAFFLSSCKRTLRVF